MSLSGRTISALKKAGITRPDEKPLGELLRLPNIGVKAITEIAERYYHAMGHFKAGDAWPELWDQPKVPIRKCSHRVPVTERCPRCVEDAELRT